MHIEEQTEATGAIGSSALHTRTQVADPKTSQAPASASVSVAVAAATPTIVSTPLQVAMNGGMRSQARTQPQPQVSVPVKAHQPPTVLAVLDGWGVAPPSRANAISMARTPNMNMLMQEYPTVTLHASGEEVGLPYNEMGNSEVGHLNIGAGKIMYQSLPRIDKEISNGSFFEDPTFLEAMKLVKERKSSLHLLGLASYGGIHSSQDHLFALLDLCKKQELTEQVFVHAILDGRDTPRNAALESIAKLETKMEDVGVGQIASLHGRYWAMDRDNRWDRIEAAYNAIRYGKATHTSDSPLKAIEDSYNEHIYDEEFRPTVILNDAGMPVATVKDGDVIIFFNFRADRARQLTKAFVLPGFSKFTRGPQVSDLVFITMTEYEKNLPVRIAYMQDNVEHPLARVLADAGMTQLHIAETEKYAHVTFFFNGGAEETFAGENRMLIPSPRVRTYDQEPEMGAEEITKGVLAALRQEQYDCIIINFANADMVGHTGNFQATVQAIEIIDKCIGKIAEAVFAQKGTLVVTADHGNAESMLDLRTGEMIKEHTLNAVPCILASEELKQQRVMWPPVTDGDVSRLQPVGVLSDVAPTLLTLMHLPVPEQMTGRSLVRMA